MKNFNFKNLTPYIAGILIFLGITVFYFGPLFQGKQLKQGDIINHKGVSKEIVDFRKAHPGEEPLWTNSIFGGMPAYQISVVYASNILKYVDKYVFRLHLPRPADYFFLYMVGFFILLLVLGVDPWLSVVGAIAFAFSSYFIIILEAGHNSKAHAISYMALVLAGVIWAYRDNIWKGALLFALALALEINANHLQITYYLLFIVLIYGVCKLLEAINEHRLIRFSKTTLILVVAALIAASTSITSLWATYDYGKDTMRGKPELTKEKEIKSEGLDKDYITSWSYGIGETWSLFIPDVKGGASGYLGNRPEVKEADPSYRKVISQQNGYWGDQPGTSGPVYVGAFVMFFFLLGFFIVKDRFKWPLLIATLLSVLLAWGKNWMPFTDFFIDYVPGYNKFRTVSMILVIAELTIPVLAFMAINEVIKAPSVINKKVNLRFVSISAFYLSLALTAGVALLFWITPTTFFSFFSQYELQQFNQLKQSNDPAQITTFMDNLERVRIAIFKVDALRSLLFIIAAAGLLWAYSARKINKSIFLLVLGVMLIADLYPVNRRYLNNDNFERKSKVDNPFQKTAADSYILQDKDPDYRVLDLTKNIFNDASTSYFHKSIGGYHGAKLQRYQDLIEYYLSSEIKSLLSVLKSNPSPESIDLALSNSFALNMLNTKYIIFNPGVNPIENRFAFGHAWIVNDFKLVDNADQEIAEMGKTDLKATAVIDKRFAGQVQGRTFNSDASATIELKSYAPNKLVYDFEGSKDQLIVFSEIYYDKGWDAFIDEKRSPYLRTDYVLRAMVIPAGKHTVEFKFEPKIWTVGNVVSLISSLLLLILVVVVLVMEIKKAFAKGNE
jgi:hypothetical protein